MKYLVENSDNSIIHSTVSTSLSSCIHMVAYCGNIELLNFLLDQGANLLARNKFGDTPLHIAIRNNQKAFAERVIQYAATLKDLGKLKLDLENHQEKLTPLMLAILREQFDIAESMINKGLATLDYLNKDGDSVNLIASRMGMNIVCEYLARKHFGGSIKSPQIVFEGDSSEPDQTHQTPI